MSLTFPLAEWDEGCVFLPLRSLQGPLVAMTLMNGHGYRPCVVSYKHHWDADQGPFHPHFHL